MINGTLRNVRRIPSYMLESDDMYRTIENHIRSQAVGTLLDQIETDHIYSIVPYERISPWQDDDMTARWEYGLKVAELVYCEDCKHYSLDMEYSHYCYRPEMCHEFSVSPHDFCSFGEPRNPKTVQVWRDYDGDTPVYTNGKVSE